MMMDRMTDEIREEAPWIMMFADDIVICSESKEQVEEKLESWRYALERRGMKVNRRKTEYMCVNERQDNSSGTVKMQGEEVAKVEDFKYLGSTVQSNGECGREVKKRVQAGWNGWRRMSGVIDRRVPARVKGKVYKVAVRPAMLYQLVWVGDSGTDEKTGGGDGGGRVEDVAIFIRSDKNRVHTTFLSQNSRPFQGLIIFFKAKQNLKNTQFITKCASLKAYIYWLAHYVMQ